MSGSGTNILAIAYRHVAGGEKEFLRTGQQIRASGKETANQISALDHIMGELGDRLKSLPGPIGAVARGFSDIYGKVKGLPIVVGALAGAVLALAAAMTGMVAAANKALDALAPFEQSMKNVQAASGATEEELKKLSDTALEISKNTRFDPTQAAEGLYALSSAGFSANEQMEALPQTLSFAEAAQADLGQATEIVVGALKTFGFAASDSKKVADTFTASIAVSSLNADRLQVAMRNAGPAAVAMGQSFEGTVAALSVLTNKFNNGELAGTGFKSALGVLADKAKEVGISVYDSSGKFLPFVDIIERLEQKGVTGQKVMQVFGNEAGPALSAALKTGSAALREMEKNVQANGQAAATAAKQIDTLKGDQAKLANSIQVFWIRIGEAIEGSQRNLYQTLTQLVQKATDWVQEHADDIRKAWELMTGAVATSLDILVKTLGFLVDHFDTLKEVVIALGIAFLGLKIGALTASLVAFIGTATLAEVAGYGLVLMLQVLETVTLAASAAWKALTASMLANPVGAIIAVIALLTFAVVRYIDKTNQAYDAELKRVQSGQEFKKYLDELKNKTDALTLSEAQYGKQQLETMRIEAAKARSEANRLAANDKKLLFGFVPRTLEKGNPISQQARDAAGIALELEQNVKRLEEELVKLGIGASVVVNTNNELAETYDNLDKKLKDSIKGHRLAAEQALALYNAHKKGGSAVLDAQRAIEIQNALLSAETTLATEAGKAIAKWVGLEFDRKRATDLLVDSQSRLRDIENQVADARAKVTDIIAGNTAASTEAARAAEVEAFRIEHLIDADDARVESLRRLLEQRDREVKAAEIEADRAQSALDFKNALTKAEAELRDAKDQSTRNSRIYEAQLEIENRVKKIGKDITKEQFLAILNDTIGRKNQLDVVKDQTDQQIRQNTAEAEYKRALADQSDYRARIEITKKYGKDLSSILINYGAASKATRQLAIDEEVLTIARGKSGEVTDEVLAGIRLEVEARYKALDALDEYRKRAELLAYVNEPINDAWLRTKDTIVGVVGDVLTGADVDWGNFLQSMLNQWVKALLEMLVRWIATHKLMQAEAARTAAANAAASASGNYGPAQNGGNIADGVGGATGAGGGAATGAGAGAGAAALGTVAVFAAIYFGVSAWIRSHRREWAELTVNTEGSTSTLGSGKSVGALTSALSGFIEGIRAFVKSAGGEFINLQQDLTVGSTGQGKKKDYYVKLAGSILMHFGNDIQAALEYATIVAVKNSDSRGLSPLVKEAIQKSLATTMETFQDEISKFTEIANLGVPDVVSEVRNTTSHLDELRDSLTSLNSITPAVIEGFNNLQTAELNAWQSSRDAITGRERSAEEELALSQQKAKIWNAEKQLRLADLALKAIEIRALILSLQVSGGRGGSGGRPGQGAGTAGGSGGPAQAILVFANSMVTAGQVALTTASVMTSAAVTQLEALQVQLAAIEALQLALASIPDIDPSEITLRGGGGGSSKSDDQARLKDILKEHDWNQSLRGLSDYQKGVKEINRRWDEAEKLAHGNAELLEKIAKARREEIEALREQAREKLKQDLKPYLADWGKSGLTLQMEELRKKFDEARKSAKELGIAKWKIDLAERRALQELGQQAIQSLGLPSDQIRAQMKNLGDTMKFLRTNMVDLGLTEEDLARITKELGQQQYASLVDGLNKYIQDEDVKTELAQLRYEMEIANYKLQFELLKANGILTDEQIARVQGLIDRLPAKVPTETAAGGDSAADLYLQRQADADRVYKDWLQQRADDLKDLSDQIRSYEDLNLSGPARELRDLNATFDEMRAKARELGFDMNRLENAYRLAIEDFWKRLLEPLQNYRNDLAFESFSPLSAQQQLEEAQRRFDDLAARAAAGDLDALAGLPDAARLLLEQARGFFNSGQGFQDIFQRVMAILDALLAASNLPGPSPALNPSLPTPATAAAANIIQFPTQQSSAPTRAGSSFAAQQGQPLIVSTSGSGSGADARAEIADLKTKLIELERELLRVALESRSEQEQTNEKLDQLASLIAEQNAYMQRLIGQLASKKAAEPPGTAKKTA